MVLFTGSGLSITAAAGIPVTVDDDITFCCWARADIPTSDPGTVWSLNRGFATNFLTLSITSGRWRLTWGSPSAGSSALDIVTASVDEWVFIAVTREVTGDGISELKALLIPSNDYSLATYVTTTVSTGGESAWTRFDVGTFATLLPYVGDVSTLKIYSRAMTRKEMEWEANTVIPKSTGSLEAWYPLQNIAGQYKFDLRVNDTEVDTTFVGNAAGEGHTPPIPWSPPPATYNRLIAACADRGSPVGRMRAIGLCPDVQIGRRPLSAEAPLGRMQAAGLCPSVFDGEVVLAPVGLSRAVGLCPDVRLERRDLQVEASTGHMRAAGLCPAVEIGSSVQIEAPLGRMRAVGLCPDVQIGRRSLSAEAPIGGARMLGPCATIMVGHQLVAAVGLMRAAGLCPSIRSARVELPAALGIMRAVGLCPSLDMEGQPQDVEASLGLMLAVGLCPSIVAGAGDRITDGIIVVLNTSSPIVTVDEEAVTVVVADDSSVTIDESSTSVTTDEDPLTVEVDDG